MFPINELLKKTKEKTRKDILIYILNLFFQCIIYLYFKLDIFTKTLITFDAKGWDFIKCLAPKTSTTGIRS